MRESPVGREVHLGFAGFTFLRGDDDHTVGTAATVDGRGGSILEDFDVLDVVWVDKTQRVGALLVGRSAVAWCAACLKGHAVDNIQRLGRRGERVGTTDDDTHAAARSTVALVDLHTGDLTLHAVGDIHGTAFHQVFASE